MSAIAHNEKIYEIIEDEMSKERIKRGWTLILTGGIALAATILTAGVVPAWIMIPVGPGVITYDVSNIEEGIQDLYYGYKGDPYTVAINPMCDTIFQGDRDTYDLYGIISHSVGTSIDTDYSNVDYIQNIVLQ